MSRAVQKRREGKWLSKAGYGYLFFASLLIFVLIYLSLATAAWAQDAGQTWSSTFRAHLAYGIKGPPSDGIAGSPHLAELKGQGGVTRGRTLLTYFQFGSDGVSQIAYRVSDDGVRWTLAKQIPGTENGIDPSAVQLANGEVLIVYADYINGAEETAVNITRSRDLANWSLPETLVPSQSGNNALAPSIAALSDGRVLVVFSYGYEQRASDLYLIESRDNGLSWSQPKLVYGGPQYDSKADLIELDNGDLLAAFYTSAPFPYGSGIPRRGDILAVRSSDGGATWQGPFVVYGQQNRDECWVSLLQRGNGEIWAAFTVDQGDKKPSILPSIKLVKSSDRGVTWSQLQTVSSGLRRYSWPALAQRTNGTVMLLMDDDAWYNIQQRTYWSLWEKNSPSETYFYPW